MMLQITLLACLSIFASCDETQTQRETTSVVKQDHSSASGRFQVEPGITVVFQDSKGNYWFAVGETGIYRYEPFVEDAVPLTLYTKEDGIAGPGTLGIQEDKEGNIYFDSLEGVTRFDGKSFTILEEAQAPLTGEWELNPDDMWFRKGWDHSGPYRYDGEYLYHMEFPKSPADEAFRQKYPNVSFNPYGIYSLYEDHEGHLWFGTASMGVCRYDGSEPAWLFEEHHSTTPEGGAFGVRSTIQDANGQFWFCNPRFRYNLKNESKLADGIRVLQFEEEPGVEISSQDASSSLPYFMSMAIDEKGDLWGATYSEGVFRIRGTELEHFDVMDGEIHALCYSIHADNDGKIWLGTHESGIYTFDGKGFVRFEI